MTDARISRRSVLGSVGAVSLSSALVAQSAEALTAARAGEAVPGAVQAFRAVLKMGPCVSPGEDAGCGWAAILGGEVEGPLLCGTVQPGRVDWRVDAASHMLEVAARFSVLRADGSLIEVKDRAVHPVAQAPAAVTGICTSPELLDAASEMPASPELLVGRLDAARFGSGVVVLSAYKVV